MNILLMKAPTFPYPRLFKPRNFSERPQVYSSASLALASLKAFTGTYFRVPHELHVHDLSIHALDYAQDLDAIGDAALAAGKNIIETTDFDVFAISVQFMFNQPYAIDLTRWAREKNPQAAIIAGGGYATIFPEKCMRLSPVDYAVIGEGDHTFVHILNRIAGVKDAEFEAEWPFDGYVTRQADGSLHKVDKTSFLPELGRLPRPDWHYDAAQQHLRRNPGGSKASLPAMASRGCPMSCSFCSTHLTWGKPVRYRPVQDVVDEFINHYRDFGATAFHLVDDNITFDKTWLPEFADALIAQQPVPFECTISNFDLRHLNLDVVKAVKKLGVYNLCVAIESGDPEIQHSIRKKLNLGRVRNTIKMIQDQGLTVHTALMLGFPDESLQQMHNTIDYVRQLRTDSVQISRTFPYPGTEVYEQAKRLGVLNLDEDDFASLIYERGCINTKEWTTDQVRDIAYDAQLELNFLSSPFYDSEQGRGYLRAKVERLLGELPGHVVLDIVAGYMDARFFDKPESRDIHFDRALEALRDEDCTFHRHIGWNFPQMQEFRAWVQANRPSDSARLFAGAADVSASSSVEAI